MHNYIKLCGVIDFPFIFLGFISERILSLNYFINFTNCGLNLCYGRVLKFCKSLSFYVGLTRVKQFLSGKNDLNCLLIWFLWSDPLK